MNLIGNKKPLKATKKNKLANDCPTNCRKDHCDECPFRIKFRQTTNKYTSNSSNL